MSNKQNVLGGNPTLNSYNLNFIIEGDLFTGQYDANKTLREVLEHALNKSQHTGRPVDDWQVKVAGITLDVNQKLSNLGLSDEVKLVVSLKTGAGGKSNWYEFGI